jgi:hypothetical protein
VAEAAAVISSSFLGVAEATNAESRTDNFWIPGLVLRTIPE